MCLRVWYYALKDLFEPGRGLGLNHCICCDKEEVIWCFTWPEVLEYKFNQEKGGKSGRG
jgi:hypothetical protein